MKPIRAEPVTLGRVRIIEQNIPPKSRPIIFDAESVRGILAGTKWQTRRVAKFPSGGYVQPLRDGRWEHSPDGGHDWGLTTLRCPYGGPGGRLYVKEAWHLTSVGDDDGAPLMEPPVWYDADGEPEGHYPFRRSPLFMPRAFSRLTLEVLDVRVERLQSISPADAIAEGITPMKDQPLDGFGPHYDVGPLPPNIGGYGATNDPVEAYKCRWDAINGRRKGATWADNPWCWCISFRRVDKGEA